MLPYMWSTSDKAKIQIGATVVLHWESGGGEIATFAQSGVFCPDDAVPKVFVKPVLLAAQYVPLAHCDPKSVRASSAVRLRVTDVPVVVAKIKESS